jgi:hypothetical protein
MQASISVSVIASEGDRCLGVVQTVSQIGNLGYPLHYWNL